MNKKKEELNIEIKTKLEAYWSQVLKETEEQIKVLEGRLTFEKAVLEMAQKKINKEKQNGK